MGLIVLLCHGGPLPLAGAVLRRQSVELDGHLIESPAHVIQALVGGIASSKGVA